MLEVRQDRYVKAGTDKACSKLTMFAVVKTLNSSLRGKKIAVLGYAFKSDTSDTRDSQAAAAIRQLLGECPAEINIFDPLCHEATIRAELAGAMRDSTAKVMVCDDPYTACSNAAAVVIMTEWKQFCYPSVDLTEDRAKRTKNSEEDCDPLMAEPECAAGCQECSRSNEPSQGRTSGSVDWAKIAKVVAAPKWVFDGRGLVNPDELQKLGFRVNAIGRAGIQSRWLGV